VAVLTLVADVEFINTLRQNTHIGFIQSGPNILRVPPLALHQSLRIHEPPSFSLCLFSHPVIGLGL